MTARGRLRLGLLGLSVMIGGCLTGLRSEAGIATRASSDGATPPIVNATVPFAILLVIGLVISRTFKSD